MAREINSQYYKRILVAKILKIFQYYYYYYKKINKIVNFQRKTRRYPYEFTVHKS